MWQGDVVDGKKFFTPSKKMNVFFSVGRFEQKTPSCVSAVFMVKGKAAEYTRGNVFIYMEFGEEACENYGHRRQTTDSEMGLDSEGVQLLAHLFCC